MFRVDLTVSIAAVTPVMNVTSVCIRASGRLELCVPSNTMKAEGVGSGEDDEGSDIHDDDDEVDDKEGG